LTGKIVFGISLILAAIVILLISYFDTINNIRDINDALNKVIKRDFSKKYSTYEDNEFKHLHKTVNEAAELVEHLIETRRIREEEFITVLNAITSPIFIVNSQGKIVVSNSSSEKVMRKTLQNIIPEFYYEAIRNDELNKFIENAIKNRFQISKSIYIEAITYEITSFPFKSKDGDFTLFFANDITEKERTKKMQKEFIESTSHELRTPLSIIAGIVEIIRSENLIKKNGQRFLQPLEESTTRMNEITSKIAILMEVESLSNRTDQKINLSEIAEEVVLKYSDLAKSKGLDAKLSTDKGAYIRGNKLLIYEMLANLVENAIKYTDKGYIEVDIRKDKFANIIVSDTGRGIDEKFIGDIFEPFSREGFSRNRETSGLGLGLAITKRIVELHNGKITVMSRKNHYTRFTVQLPLLREIDKKLT
jgi:two-component system phosphate regulon sensor histidine kinase PhoR